MAVSDRAVAAAPYLQALMDDSEVRSALRRTASAGRDTYRRARGKRPGKAVKDKRLRRRAQEAAIASWTLVCAIDAAQARRRPRRGRRALLVLVALAGAYGAYLVSNDDGRETLRDLITNRDASSQGSHAQ
jgi:hypothetical protein